jgi:Fe-S-cluster containining protein
MSDSPDALARARGSLVAARDPQRLPHAVMAFHQKIDAMVDESIRVHQVAVACRRGCSHCCHMQVEILPPEAFALAAWLKRQLDASALDAVRNRLRGNAARTRQLGDEGRKRANMPCALLGSDGACTAYAARPAQCRRFHSTHLPTCEASFAAPDDDSISSPAHPLVMHNVQVVVTVAQHGLRDAGLDSTPRDMNLALLEALEGSTAERRWRDGKKAFV